MTNYDQELRTAICLAEQAAVEVTRFYYGTVEQRLKDDGTPVTQADVRANEIIQQGLHRAFPRDGIVSEELEDIVGERTWYIDPIDGTRGFIERSDQFAIHIGLAVEHVPVLGIVYKPTTGEYYWGIKGEGARRVSPHGHEKGMVVTSDYDLKALKLIVDKDFLTQNPGAAFIKHVNPERTSVSGSEGLRVMRVVENTADLHLTNKNNSCSTWDLCAPQAIVEAAGGYVSYLDESSIQYTGQRKLGKYFVIAKTEGLGKYAAGVFSSVTQTSTH